MASLTNLEQSRLLGIIGNTRRLVASLPGIVSRHRANSAADSADPQAVAQQETTAHTHRPRESRAQENDVIDRDHSSRTSTGTTHTGKRKRDTIGIVSRHRAYLAAAPEPLHAVAHHDTTAHTQGTRTPRVPEGTAIT
jgi:hypothetical protein